MSNAKFRLKQGFKKFQKLEIQELRNLFVKKSSHKVVQTLQLSEKNLENLKQGCVTTLAVFLDCPQSKKRVEHLLILKPPKSKWEDFI